MPKFHKEKAPPNAWNIPPPLPQPNQKNAKKHVNSATSKKQQSGSSTEAPKANSMEKFQEVHSKNVEKAKAFIQEYDSSSEEEDDINTNAIFDTVFNKYAGQQQELAKTQAFLEDIFQSGSAICLICIGTVKRADKIWTCQECYCFFHLLCVQRWANDSLYQQKMRLGEDQPYFNRAGELVKNTKPIRWCCPKCRMEYQPDEVPRHYQCFCGKEYDPPHHPWLVPHSCGEVCGKPLMPQCGHSCMLLCHPGPCPSCPQFVQVSCKCGKSPTKAVRCFQKDWMCQLRCGLVLKCGIHICEEICHAGDCPPCTRKSKQKCLCGNEVAQRNCSELDWRCKKICNRPFACGLHKCKIPCHSGECGDCPLGLPRTCPCGKEKSIAPCSEIIETCGNTCHKVLVCDEHYCAERCHKGECTPCLAIVEKKCRCGLHTKELPCSKNFTCETKCKEMRECKKHACNKKCCDGQCPPCDKVCGKTLSCHKHRCKSVCHDGPCYPCELRSQLKCRCGKTSITIPCGREKKTRPPRCSQPCRIPSKCHHQNPHRCHFNDCPTCVEKCGLKNDTTNCQHPCEAKCHAAVKVPVDMKSVTSIFDWPTEQFQIKELPHPQCEIQVEVICIGGHEVSYWPCWNSKPTSCQIPCGRILKCGNHLCQRLCHQVPDLNSKQQQEDCEPCERGCEISRSPGCIHPCKKPCHQPPCAVCSVSVKITCHCGLTQVYYKCAEYNDATLDSKNLEALREKLKSCGNRCIKNYPCTHRCTSICHSGVCPNANECRKKVKIYCDCKNLKNEISCEKYRNGTVGLPCGETCVAKKSEEDRIRREKEAKERQIEEERNRIELEQFEKKFGKKKPRERKQRLEVDERKINLKLWIGVAAAVAVVSAGLMFYFIN